jgi:hypothetical protein
MLTVKHARRFALSSNDIKPRQIHSASNISHILIEGLDEPF